MKLILASASPRRSELLSHLGIPFSVRVSDIDETVQNDETPEDYVRRLSLEKALLKINPGEYVIGADTVVVHENVILGKPSDASHARFMLEKLSGSWHEVLTGVSVVSLESRETFVVKTRVLFDSLDIEDIDLYIESLEPMDKAGAYAIQGIGGKFIVEIQGSYSNVVGLPLCELAKVLKARL